MIYIRGQKEDYNEWANLGNEGWGWKDVLPYFIKAENNENGRTEFHGDGGPLEVSNQKVPRSISHAYLEACAKSQLKISNDFNTGSNEGAGFWQSTIFHSNKKNGQRCSSAAYILPIYWKKLKHCYQSNCHKNNIWGENCRWSWIYSRWKEETGKSKKRSHYICRFSKITGNFTTVWYRWCRRYSSSWNKDVAELWSWKNLQDHIDFNFCFTTSDKNTLGISPVGFLKILGETVKWLFHGNSVISSTLSEAWRLFKTDPYMDRPDIQNHFVIGLIDDHLKNPLWIWIFLPCLPS